MGLVGCEKKIDLLCTVYNGEHLSPLEIEQGMDGQTIIKIINDYIQQVLMELELSVLIENVGTGVNIYKGISNINFVY